MTFPLGGDFSRAVNREFKVVTSDPAAGQQDGFLLSSGTPSITGLLAQLSTSSNGLFVAAQLSNSDVFLYPVFQFSIQTNRTHPIYSFLGSVSGSTFEVGLSPTASSFWRMAQFNSGDLPRLPGSFSDLYSLDVAAFYKPYQRLSIYFTELAARLQQQNVSFSSFGNLVATDYYTTISGSEDVCVGDETPPFITYIQPTISGAHVRPRNQTVEFRLGDAVGGVDLSTVSVNLTSTTTSGTISLVDSGADQTGGNVSIIGSADSYLITYVPPFLWDYNDIVTVTISGADLPPQVDGNPFFCSGGGVNYFIGDIPFQVLNEEDLSAELTVVGDVNPPEIVSTIPASGTLNNNVFTNIELSIADSLTGVNLSSLIVSVNGEVIVNAGAPTSSQTVLTGNPSQYDVVYQPSSSFAYDSTATIVVYAEDLVSTGPANVLSTSYPISFIEDSTLIIENFEPEVGTHINLESVDIQVDVRDDTYGVDEDQTFFVINGTIVSGTRTALTSGIRMTYHPPNDFAFEEPIQVTVHGTNNNPTAPVVKETFQTLFYGCRAFLFNEEPFSHADSVSVFVRARNIEEFHKDLSTGYFFSTYTQPSSNLGASIQAINPIADLPATINGLGPEHRYGETVTVEFSVEDFDGRLLGPYTFVYTIEQKSN